MQIHPTVANQVLLKTKNSGVFKWNEQSQDWKQLLNFLDYSQQNHYGVQDAVFDPQDPDIIYLVCGKGFLSADNGAILKSTDGGDSFSYLNLTCKASAYNQSQPLLAVSPFNSDIVLHADPNYDSQQKQIHRSTDGGANWSLVNLGATITYTYVYAIAFDDVTSGTCYVATGARILKSTDNGLNWTTISSGGLGIIKNMVCVSGTLWIVSYSQGESLAGVVKYESGSWSNVTPSAMSGNRAYLDLLAVNPNNKDEVIVGNSNYRRWFHTSNGGTNWSDIFNLENYAGGSFDTYIPLNVTLETPWMDSDFFCKTLLDTNCFAFDPHNQGRVWFGTGFGAFCTEDISASNASWVQKSVGLSQSSPSSLAIAGDGKLLSIGFDRDSAVAAPAFKHTLDYTSIPAQLNTSNDATLRLDTVEHICVCQSQPSILYRVGGNENPTDGRTDTTWRLQKSTNSGDTWVDIPAFYDLKVGSVEDGYENITPTGIVAAKTNPNFLIILTVNASIFYSLDGGSNFLNASFEFVSNNLIDDKLNRSITSLEENFYYYFPADPDGRNFGSMYKIFLDTDAVSLAFEINSLPLSETLRCDFIGSDEGILYLALKENGLWTTFPGIDDRWLQINSTHIENAVTIAIGLPMPGSSEKTFYIYGSVDGQWGLYWCPENNFNNLTKISTSYFTAGNNPHHLTASPSVPGEVFLATSGSGILRYQHA